MPELKVFALKKLDLIVDEFWPEISEAIEKMYVLHNYNVMVAFILNSASLFVKIFLFLTYAVFKRVAEL